MQNLGNQFQIGITPLPWKLTPSPNNSCVGQVPYACWNSFNCPNAFTIGNLQLELLNCQSSHPHPTMLDANFATCAPRYTNPQRSWQWNIYPSSIADGPRYCGTVAPSECPCYEPNCDEEQNLDRRIKPSILNKLIVSPSPANNTLRIQGLTENDDLIIFNLFGSAVFKLKINAENIDLDISNFKPGIYFMETLYSGNAKFVRQ